MCNDMMQSLAGLEPKTLHEDAENWSYDARCDNPTKAKRRRSVCGWQLDDEDKVQAVRSLIGLRFMKLVNLVNELEQIIDAHHPRQKWLIRALKKSAEEYQTRWGHIE
jgi:hypothetical protein